MPDVVIDPVVGGSARYDFGEEGCAEGAVVRAEAPHLLEHTWLWPDEPPSVVRWELAASEGGTLLVLTHAQVRAVPATDYAAGWHVILDCLGRHLRHEPLDEAWDGYEALLAAYST